VHKAAEAGAAAVCVSQPLPEERQARLAALGCAVLQVPDTLVAFQHLARQHRRSLPALVTVAITGSCGKTSTKEMLAAVLERRFPGAVLKTEGNTNNHFGVPRNLLRLSAGDRGAVLELGTNHPGEIAALARLVEPDIAVVSNIGAAHLEFFRDLAGVAREKGDLLALTAAGGLAVFHGDAAHADVLRAKAGDRRLLTFGNGSDNDVVVSYLGPSGAGSRFALTWRREGQSAEVEWGLVGAHQALNAGAAAAVGGALGLAPGEVAAGLCRVKLPGMRTERRTLRGVNWVNDAYNANPDSLRAGIETFLEWSAGQPPELRLLVLGDMLEQGDRAVAVHRELIQWAQGRAPGAELLLVGCLMAEAAAGSGLRTVPDCAAAAAYLRERVVPGMWVFVKGSHGLHLEGVLPAEETTAS
jgi:UDP-N-acetylmuramoyl-tripeptide--D-alanyl-D-alanine ligase